MFTRIDNVQSAGSRPFASTATWSPPRRPRVPPATSRAAAPPAPARRPLSPRPASECRLLRARCASALAERHPGRPGLTRRTRCLRSTGDAPPQSPAAAGSKIELRQRALRLVHLPDQQRPCAPRGWRRGPRSTLSPWASSAAPSCLHAARAAPVTDRADTRAISSLGHHAARPRHRLARLERLCPAALSSALARPRSPSCAMAMPRCASAGASSRSATRFQRPEWNRRPAPVSAAVISESIQIPSHPSLSPALAPAHRSSAHRNGT